MASTAYPRTARWEVMLGAVIAALLSTPACVTETDQLPSVPPAGIVPIIQEARPVFNLAFGCQDGDERSVTVSVRVRPDGTPSDVWITAASDLQGASLEACYRSNLMGWRWIPAQNALGELVPSVWTQTFTIVT